MSQNNILILFDVDGTLTQSRQHIDISMINSLLKLKKMGIHIATLGGSDLQKQKEQITDKYMDIFNYVFCENGLIGYDQIKSTKLYDKKIIDKLKIRYINKLINICLKNLSNIDIPMIKKGNFVELRNSMLNISIIGRNCNQIERESFELLDKKYKYREQLINAIKEDLLKEKFKHELVFSIGGQISVDIFPLGWDKTYCLSYLKDKYNRILFFGDKTEKGGNDYEIYNHELTESYKVNNPFDTIDILNKLFF